MSKTLLSTTTGFLYDGANPVQEQSGGSVTANLLTGGIDERFQRTDSTGSYSYLTDALGSTEALTSATGAEQTTYSYGPYGSLSITGTNSNDYTYTGRESDGLGILYYRARYYNPQTGRFISEDPAGFAGSGPDLYAYVFDNPTNAIDPSGLDVTVAYYPSAAGGQGHIGIGVNTDNTVGFYPANGFYEHLSPFFSVPGRVFTDSTKQSATPELIHLQTTPQQDQAMQQAINQWTANPGEYNLTGRNCAKFVEDVLNAGLGTNGDSGDFHPWWVFQWLQAIRGFY